jgi:hypothetical protein
MKVYQTDENGYFVGEEYADRDPLNKENWLIPGGCVTDAPPDTGENQRAKWQSGKWVVEDIVEPETKPEEPTDLATEARAKRNSLLAQSDWTQVGDAPVDQAAWATYRQALRDITEQEGFPEIINWPTAPS